MTRRRKRVRRREWKEIECGVRIREGVMKRTRLKRVWSGDERG